MRDSAGFVHLHAHSSYSLSEGAIKAEKLPALAREAGMPAVALTDSANLFGALEFSMAAAGKGVQPILGCQLFLSRTAADDRPEAERAPPDPVVALAIGVWLGGERLTGWVFVALPLIGTALGLILYRRELLAWVGRLWPARAAAS